MPDLYVRFNSWLAGNAGRLDPGLAPSNAWYGTNVQVYPTGLIGPRWGLKQVSVLAPGGGNITIPAANGPRGFATIGDKLLVCADKTYMGSLTTLASGSVTTTAFAAYPASPTKWVTYVAQTDSLIFALVDNVLYKHNTTGMTTTAVTTQSPLSFIRRWNLYCVGVDNVVPYRLWFSQVNSSGFDFGTWPVGNSIDIGDNEPITAIVPLYNTLFVGKRSGWWAVTGVVGTSSAVRQVSIGDGPVDPRGASATTDNRVAYWPRSPNPAHFNGSSTQVMLDQLGVVYTPTAAQAVASVPTGRTTVYGYDSGSNSSSVMLSQLGGPSRHDYGVRLAGFAPDVIENGYGLTPGYVMAAKQATTAGEALAVYFWRTDPDRPPLSTDTLGSYGDGTTVPLEASISTRAWTEPQGRDVRVRNVIVHFRAWGIGSSGNQLQPGFGISIERLNPYDDRGGTTNVQHWRLPYGEAAVDGDQLTARFAFGDQGFANGFRINVVDMVGVAINDIVVGVDVHNQRV